MNNTTNLDHIITCQYFNLAPVMFLAIDKDYNVIKVNPKTCEILGYTNEDILGKNWIQHFIAKENRESVQKLFEEIIFENSGHIRNCDYTVTTKNGESKIISWNSIEYINSEGKITGILNCGEDKTRQEQIKDDLQKLLNNSEKQRKAYLILLNDMMGTSKQLKAELDWHKNAEKILNQTGRIAKIGGWEHDLQTGKATWTKALYDIVEIEDGDPPGVDEHLSYYPEPYRSILEKAYIKCAEKGLPFKLQLQGRTHLGKLFWGEVYGEAEYQNGKIVKLRGTFQDISSQKETEQELEKNYEILHNLTQHLQNAREEQNAHIAREIHDDLGQILSSTEILVTLLENELINNSDFNASVSSLLQEIRNHLDLSVNKTRELSLNLHPVILENSSLTEAINWLVTSIKQKTEIVIKINIEANLPVYPDDKKLALYRIIQESLNNILRHANATTINLNMTTDEKYLLISIKDNGRGFNPEQIDDHESFGILSMKERVLFCKGEFHIKSKKGNGTLITVQIPKPEKND